MTASIPICFYPMRKIVLDDDQSFTQSILLHMYDKNFIKYDSPEELLRYLLNAYQPSFSKHDLITLNPSAENGKTYQTVDIHIDKLKHLMFTTCHNDINIILVDYHMPEMCGMEFLKKIKHLPMKKVLITGESDLKIAIDAFNQGLVDAYIRKDELNFPKKIQKLVSELEWKYFTEVGSFIPDIPEFNYLKDNNLLNFFRNMIDENRIKSYCIANMQGDFIIQDQQKKQKILLIRDVNQLLTLAKIAKEDGASQYVIEKLEKTKAIPFFGNKEYWEIPGSEWEQYLYPVNEITANVNYLWTCIS